MIDWPALAAELASPAELEAVPIQATPVTGGDINRCFRLQWGSRTGFVKINRRDCLAMFEAEARGLELIHQSNTLRAPNVFRHGQLDNFAYLVLEYIELGSAPDAETLALGLASMHRCQSSQFGLAFDNTIGTTHQVNRQRDDWVEFWREHRLGNQLELATANGLSASLIDAGRRLAEELPHWFQSYAPSASLLHGDLWSGNYASDEQGLPVVYDPAGYYGDHETDLAMMELFGHPGARFFDCYHDHFAIDADYPARRDLYNLYHVLNHANLFGGSYIAQAERMIGGLLATVR